MAKLLFDQLEANAFKPEIILNSFETEEEHKEVAKILNTNILDMEATSKDKERAVNDAIKIILKEHYDIRYRSATSLGELQEIMKYQRELADLHISIN